MGLVNWNEIDKLYYLAHVNMGRASSWKERRLRSKLRLTAMFPYAVIVGTVNKMRGILETRRMQQCRSEKYHLAIVAIAKNEGPYLAEWCTWHRFIGVDCIILYDNDSTDDTPQVLQPFIDDGFVIYNRIYRRGKQLVAYHDAIKRYGALCRYMAIIDCDEFLHPLNEGESLKDIVDSTFARSKNIGGIGANWAIFGSSGHTTKTPGLVIERFIYRSKPEFGRNRHIKSIVRPECVEKFPNPHCAIYRTGFYCVNTTGNFVRWAFSPVSDGWYRLRIEHYYIKSNEEFLKRCEQGNADTTTGKRPLDTLISDNRNDVCDMSMACHSSEIRKMLTATQGEEYMLPTNKKTQQMEKEAHTISVVMATYNGEKYLKEQIDSILAQNYPIHELIIQDDCSTDQTVAIANEYAKRYPVVKVFQNQRNLGLNQNFKTAVMRATGDFVAISDQDDVWYKDKLERQIAAIGNRDVCSSSYAINLATNELKALNYRHNVERLLFFSHVCGHTMLCRRDFVQNPNNWQDYMWYDWSLSLHASLGNGHIQIEEPLVWHRIHSGEVSNIINRKYEAMGNHSILFPYLHGLKEYRKWLNDNNRRTIYTHLLQVTADGRNPLVHRFCDLLLKDDLPSILRLCRLCQKHRNKIYFNKSANGVTGWIRGFFFPMIYSCSLFPYVFYKEMS